MECDQVGAPPTVILCTMNIFILTRFHIWIPELGWDNNNNRANRFAGLQNLLGNYGLAIACTSVDRFTVLAFV